MEKKLVNSKSVAEALDALQKLTPEDDWEYLTDEVLEAAGILARIFLPEQQERARDVMQVADDMVEVGLRAEGDVVKAVQWGDEVKPIVVWFFHATEEKVLDALKKAIAQAQLAQKSE